MNKLEWKPSSLLTLDLLETGKGNDRVKPAKIYYDSKSQTFIKPVQKTDVDGEWKAEKVEKKEVKNPEKLTVQAENLREFISL